IVLATVAGVSAQRGQPPANAPVTVLRPARVFDGDTTHEGWSVRVKGERIDAVGPDASVAAAGATVIDLPGTTLTPGLIDGHSRVDAGDGRDPQPAADMHRGMDRAAGR